MDADELKNKGKEFQGKAEEYASKLTDDDDDELEGGKDQLQGEAKQKSSGLTDKAKDIGRKITGD